MGQNESGGVKQCTGHFYYQIIREPMVTIVFIFPLEQRKQNDTPFIISSLASIPVNQRQKCHLTHFSPPAPLTLSCPWMQHKLTRELVALEITDTHAVAASEVSAT